jgi:hypothetical protein
VLSELPPPEFQSVIGCYSQRLSRIERAAQSGETP